MTNCINDVKDYQLNKTTALIAITLIRVINNQPVFSCYHFDISYSDNN